MKTWREAWHAYLECGIPLPPIAGGTNVASLFTRSTSGFFTVITHTVSATNFSGVDSLGGGKGARLRYRLQGPVVPTGGRMGVQRLEDGTDIGSYFAPASWRDGWSPSTDTPTPPAPPLIEEDYTWWPWVLPVESLVIGPR